MNLLCNINQSFADLLINYLNLIKKESVLFGGVCKKSVLKNFAKIFKKTFFFKELLPKE